MGQTPPGGATAGSGMTGGVNGPGGSGAGGGFMAGFATEFGAGSDGADGPKPGEELGPGALGHKGPKLLLDPPTLRTLGGLGRPHPMHVYVVTGFLLIMGYKEEELRVRIFDAAVALLCLVQYRRESPHSTVPLCTVEYSRLERCRVLCVCQNWQRCREILRAMAEGEKARARPVRVLRLKPDVLLHTRVWLTKYHGPELPVARSEADRVVDWCRRVCDAFDAQEDLVVVPPWQGRST